MAPEPRQSLVRLERQKWEEDGREERVQEGLRILIHQHLASPNAIFWIMVPLLEPDPAYFVLGLWEERLQMLASHCLLWKPA